MGPGVSGARSRRTRRGARREGPGWAAISLLRSVASSGCSVSSAAVRRRAGATPGTASAGHRRARCAQEVRSRSGRSPSPGFAGIRRVNRGLWVPDVCRCRPAQRVFTPSAGRSAPAARKPTREPRAPGLIPRAKKGAQTPNPRIRDSRVPGRDQSACFRCRSPRAA